MSPYPQTHDSVCASEDYSTVEAEEKMFGLGGHFLYHECRDCGHVALAEIPSDIARYYPPNYYSFRQPHPIKTYLKSRRAAHGHGQRNIIGALMEWRLGPEPTVAWFKQAGVKQSDRILDVGCGTGIFLRDLQNSGFQSITGVDPYIDRDYRYGSVQIKKKSIFELQEQFDSDSCSCHR